MWSQPLGWFGMAGTHPHLVGSGPEMSFVIEAVVNTGLIPSLFRWKRRKILQGDSDIWSFFSRSFFLESLLKRLLFFWFSFVLCRLAFFYLTAPWPIFNFIVYEKQDSFSLVNIYVCDSLFLKHVFSISVFFEWTDAKWRNPGVSLSKFWATCCPPFAIIFQVSSALKSGLIAHLASSSKLFA